VKSNTVEGADGVVSRDLSLMFGASSFINCSVTTNHEVPWNIIQALMEVKLLQAA
jgi:hypothetical protein